MRCFSWVPLVYVAGGFAVIVGCNRSDTPSSARSAVRAKEPQVQVEPPRVQAKESLVQATSLQLRDNQEDVDAFFANPTILRLQIEIPRSGLSALRRTRWENGQERPVVKATITEGGVIYSNVAIHLKGAAGSFRPVDDKPALTLSFNKFEPGQAFHGLRKISLNNSVQDPSYLCEKICREIFISAGVPVPRAAHAMVTLNGRDLGLYVLLEGANKQFLKRYFSNASGNLYDGGFCKDIRASLAINCGDNPKDHSGLKALISAVRERRPDFARLEQVLDTDRFLSMVAIEMMLGHWDGYSMNRNNWRVFHDLDSKKMVFIPHGLDQMFGSGRQFDPGIAPQHVSGEVARAILATREGQRRYHQRVAQLYTNVLQVDEIMSRVDEIVAGLRPVLVESDPAIARSLQQQASRLKQRIIHRGESLRRQLGVPVKPSEFSGDGVIRLTGWKPSLVLSGNPTLAQVNDPTGKPLLAINAGTGTSSGSWRTRIVLGVGRYQFEGRVRVLGVTIEDGDIRGGAGLRISKGIMPRKLSGTSEWADYSYPFSVEDEVAEVELICELRAAQGEARFDASSLRLVRLP